MQANQAEPAQPAQDAALGWIVRFRSDSVSDEDRQGFALWLAEAPEHRQAMDAMLDMWADLASVRQLYAGPQELTSRPAANSGRWWKASLAGVAAVVVALVLWPQQQPTISGQQYYQTALGEQRRVELDDGSYLTLNTNSRIQVSFSDERRRLELVRGEAFFEVAKDPSRPFDVDTGNALVTAVGTAFNIYRDDSRASITVTEGVVRITELGDTGSRVPTVEILRANQQLSATPRGLQPVTPVDIGQYTAWQRGELVARDMPLAELVRQIERYHDTHILITDAGIAALTISGVFTLSDLDPILQALQVSLGVRAVPVDDNTLQLIRSPEPT